MLLWWVESNNGIVNSKINKHVSSVCHWLSEKLACGALHSTWPWQHSDQQEIHHWMLFHEDQRDLDLLICFFITVFNSILSHVPPLCRSIVHCCFSLLTEFSFVFSREQKQQFKELVEVKFHEWLLETGHRQELDSLIPPTIDSLNDSDVNATKQTRTGRAVGESPMACWIVGLALFGQQVNCTCKLW